MKGQELEELRSQLNLNVDDFAKRIGISALDYEANKRKDSIQDIAIVTKVHDMELLSELENLNNYKKILSAQPAGPFSSGKIFSHVQKIAQLKENSQQTPPITIEWHLSNRCNHDCPFCTFRESVHFSPTRSAIFPEKLIEQTVKDLKTLGVKAVVYSGGGEPLLYSKVREVMREVAGVKIRQGLVTNGVNIEKPEIAETILEICDWIRISVDAGSQEVYKKTHGSGRDFSQIVKNIKKLIKKRGNKKKPKIGVSFLLNMQNFSDLLPSASLFKEVGVDYFQVKPIVISAEERLSSGNIFWKTEIFNQLVALPVQAEQPRYMVYTLGFKFVDMMTAVDKKQFKKCYGHPFYPVITATGDVYVCCLMIGKPQFCYGTITSVTGFKKLWKSAKRTRIGQSVNVRNCPVNCKLSETNRTLEQIFGKRYEDEDFLN